ncbi:MAG TPA: MgtC/SapB family protein [Chloroflexota bacterium]|nr:MgtC/SapB family protein [Chloroflexota bacterium]
MDWLDLVALQLLPRVILGFLLGGIIGLEREWRAKVAGLRTHALVAGGSAMFTVASAALFPAPGPTHDPARIAAQIVTGVGFLGAGAILRAGGTVIGLTTAASIWVAAALGLLAGAGAYALALASTLVTLVVLRFPARRLGLTRPQLQALRGRAGRRRGQRRTTRPLI